MSSRSLVLVVDDERGVRESLRFLLEPSFDVLTVPSGEAALEMLRERAVDVVLLDLAMPGMSGLDTLARIRERDAAIEVVIMTGYGSQHSAAEIERPRAHGLITKPFASGRILSIVRSAANARYPS